MLNALGNAAPSSGGSTLGKSLVKVNSNVTAGVRTRLTTVSKVVVVSWSMVPGLEDGQSVNFTCTLKRIKDHKRWVKGSRRAAAYLPPKMRLFLPPSALGSYQGPHKMHPLQCPKDWQRLVRSQARFFPLWWFSSHWWKTVRVKTYFLTILKL